jgi:hypothetical protein
VSKARKATSRDLAFMGVAAPFLLILAVLPFDGLLKALILAPFVLFLPGYAIAAAIFMPGTIARGERLVYAVALSVAAATIGGLFWQFLLDLDRFAWAFVLASIALIASAVAQRRRVLQPPAEDGGRPAPVRVGLATVAVSMIALAIAIAAINVAIDGLYRQRAESHFSSLWVVPRAPDGAVEIGIWNHQGEVHEYRLDVDGAGRPLRRWEGRLGSRASKQLVLDPGEVPRAGGVVVSLYEDGVLYRRTELQGGGA